MFGDLLSLIWTRNMEWIFTPLENDIPKFHLIRTLLFVELSI